MCVCGVCLENVKCEIIFQLKTNILSLSVLFYWFSREQEKQRKKREKKKIHFSMTLVKVDSVYWLIKLSILCVCWNWGSKTKEKTHKKIIDKLQWFQVVCICLCEWQKQQQKKKIITKKINLKGIRSHYQNVFTQRRFFLLLLQRYKKK